MDTSQNTSTTIDKNSTGNVHKSVYDPRQFVKKTFAKLTFKEDGIRRVSQGRKLSFFEIIYENSV
jgi:hypothetical protein